MCSPSKKKNRYASNKASFCSIDFDFCFQEKDLRESRESELEAKNDVKMAVCRVILF